jgi:sulfoxide reductase heme-binding subunit YedZ
LQAPRNYAKSPLVRRLDPLTILLWALLALPALLWSAQAARMAAPDIEDLLAPTGEMSARLIIAALALTPLLRLLPTSHALRWLAARRRHLGVAAFAYAALHTLFYVLAMGRLNDMLAELGSPGIWTGWLAMLLMVPLAATSNDAAMRALRRGWKRVQRLAYPAALLTLAHWMLVHDDRVAALAHFLPLVALQFARLAQYGQRRRTPVHP